MRVKLQQEQDKKKNNPCRQLPPVWGGCLSKFSTATTQACAGPQHIVQKGMNLQRAGSRQDRARGIVPLLCSDCATRVLEDSCRVSSPSDVSVLSSGAYLYIELSERKMPGCCSFGSTASITELPGVLPRIAPSLC